MLDYQNTDGGPGVSPLVSYEQALEIGKISEFAGNDTWCPENIMSAFDYWQRRYVHALNQYIDIKNATLCDGACGHGFFGLAYILCGGAHVRLIDANSKNVRIAEKVAKVLKIEGRCEFYCAKIQDIEMPDRSVDIFSSVETIEHVGAENIKSCIETIARTADKVVLITTPNKFFPIDSHDTHWPFMHWLPKRARPPIAALFGKRRQFWNDYANPFDLAPLFQSFRPVSRVLMYQSLRDWRSSYPYVSPYGRRRFKQQPPLYQLLWMSFSSVALRRFSFIINPNMCSVWVRKPT